MKIELMINDRSKGPGHLMLQGPIEEGDAAFLATVLVHAAGRALMVFLSSEGGTMVGARAMKEVLRRYPGHVTTAVVGACSSAACWHLLQGGDERWASNGSVLMLHDGTVSNGDLDWTSAAAWEKMARHFRDEDYRSLQRDMARGGKTVSIDWLMERLRTDWVMSVDEALQAGLLDRRMPNKYDRVAAKRPRGRPRKSHKTPKRKENFVCRSHRKAPIPDLLTKRT